MDACGRALRRCTAQGIFDAFAGVAGERARWPAECRM